MAASLGLVAMCGVTTAPPVTGDFSHLNWRWLSATPPSQAPAIPEVAAHTVPDEWLGDDSRTTTGAWAAAAGWVVEDVAAMAALACCVLAVLTRPSLAPLAGSCAAAW
eukprot:2105513-Prymnesium_polylepis.1